jgi:hypothetical protein
MNNLPLAYSVYCDESCHLENDHQKVMALGAVWCPQSKIQEIFRRIRDIKLKHKLPPDFEIKWGKVSHSKVEFYAELVDYFFDDDDLCFRCLLVPDKSSLDHARFAQSHDEFYYKIYFDMLKAIFEAGSSYKIYLDIKDTIGHRRISKLHDVLCNHQYDFGKRVVRSVEQVRSHQVELIQLADLLLGAVTYHNRGLDGNAGKTQIVRKIMKRSGYTLSKTTLVRERKMNLLKWNAS